MAAKATDTHRVWLNDMHVRIANTRIVGGYLARMAEHVEDIFDYKYMKGMSDGEEVECFVLILQAYMNMSIFTRIGEEKVIVIDCTRMIEKELAKAGAYFAGYCASCVSREEAYMSPIGFKFKRMRLLARKKMREIIEKTAEKTRQEIIKTTAEKKMQEIIEKTEKYEALRTEEAIHAIMSVYFESTAGNKAAKKRRLY